MSPVMQFVVWLVALVGAIVVLVLAAVAVILDAALRRVDGIVNGWFRHRGDDGDDGGDPDLVPPPDPPDGAARRPRLAAWQVPFAKSLLDRSAVPGPASSSPTAQVGAARVAIALHQLAAASGTDLDPYADPLPDHDRQCRCPGCVYRLAERYSKASAEDVISHVQPGEPR